MRASAKISTASGGVRKSTTTTATTVQDQAARRDKAQLSGVLHSATIGHDSARTVRQLKLTPPIEKITMSFTLALARRGANGLPPSFGSTTTSTSRRKDHDDVGSE
jgi:hypothetical protein